MCGICGIVDYRSKAQDENLLRRMCRTLIHRGPDQEGLYLTQPVALGHRRLAIIDLESGNQPMTDPSGRYTVVFNGEIYNFKQIKRDLEQQGVHFQTNSDTEVLLHLYQKQGSRMLERLRGMFAFALWDKESEQIFLARDRMGQKPLFYYQKGGLFIFASEIKAILEHPEVSREVNPLAFDDFLTYNCVPPPHTMFKDIQKLPPAHFMIFNRTGIKVESYWDVEFRPNSDLAFEEAKAGVLENLREATRLRLISDVPLGAFLSGGIDSSLVVALMSEFSDRPVKTFSIGFEEQGWSELPYAKSVADRYRTDHQEFIVRPEAIKILPRLIEHFDEPFGDSSAIPSYYLAQMTRKQLTVALNGDGGDESFAGYPRHLGTLLLEQYRRFPHWFRQNVVPGLIPDRQGRSRFFRRFRRMNQASLLSLEQAYCSFLEIHSPEDKKPLRGPGLIALLENYDAQDYILEFLKSDRGGPETLGKILYADQKTYLPDDLLVKMDRMTMAHGLESRSPFLDHLLVEFAATLPAKYKIQGRTQKSILKSIARDFLPLNIIDRPKQGFGVPVGEWFRGELKGMVSNVLDNSHFIETGWLEQGRVMELWQEHLSGKQNHSHKLWGLLNLELWYERYIK